MTPFSSVLEFYMREKNIKTYAIAQFCGIDRSNMYKMINGKRNPVSEELVEQIAEYMRLKPMERNHLVEAYQITVMGYDTYHRRKSVEDFLMSFSKHFLEMEEKRLPREYVTINVNEQKLKSWQGSMIKDRELKNLISNVLDIEIKRPSGKIYLMMQPEGEYVMDILALAGTKGKDLTIEHIFCLSNTNDIAAGKKDYNLWCLKNILPMFVQCVCDYQPYCYYDNIVSHNNRFNLLSSMIVTSEYVILFSMEEKYGTLLLEKDAIQYFQQLFQTLKRDTSLIACKMDSLEKQLNSFESIDFYNKGIGFQPESCLIPMLPPTFVEKYMEKNLLLRQAVKERVCQYICHAHQVLETSKATFIFTEEGIQRFVNTGRITELPESIYRPLEYKDCLLLVRRLIKECESGRYRMLRPDAPVSDIGICVYSAAKEGYLLLQGARKDRIFLELHESGLLYAFQDYFDALNEKYFYSKSEAIDILKGLEKGKQVR